MASPFPGMDPYLEHPAFWSDFHATFIPCWREAIAAALPDNYEARVDEWLQVVEQEPLHTKDMKPDGTVTHAGKGKRLRSSGTATLEPVIVPHVQPLERRQGYIQILRRPERSLITVLELLSPANKENPGLDQYLDKRQTLLRRQAQLVELDLLH